MCFFGTGRSLPTKITKLCECFAFRSLHKPLQPIVLPSTNPEYDVQTTPDSGKARPDRGTTQVFGHFLYLSVMFPDVFCLPPLFCGTHLDTEASADYAAKRWQK